jgi:uncharacterized protein (TIGR03083 family)
MPTDAELLDLMEQAWSAVEELCSSLAPVDWGKTTDCPGWTVKDQLAHMAALESGFLGRPPAEGDLPRPSHVKNDLGAHNEREIEARRALPPERILEEFREVTAERLKVLSSLEEAGWGHVEPGPLGEAAVRDRIPIRIVDTFFHEQDIRRAVGRPGHMNGAVARLVLDRMTAGMGFVVGKRVKPPDGTTVVFDVGAPGRSFALEMKEGRAAPVDPPAQPTVRLRMDAETFLCLAGGRRSHAQASSGGRLVVEGDRHLGATIIQNMAVTP